jgi:hypothetical protein
MVTAGRDRGNHAFERDALGEQLRFGVAALRAAGVRRVQVALTPLSDAGERLADELTGGLGAPAGVVPDADIVLDEDRAGGRGYYRDLCFKVNALVEGGGAEEIGDGGLTDWTARLLANGKERLLISGYGTDRLAAVTGSAQGGGLAGRVRRIRRGRRGVLWTPGAGPAWWTWPAAAGSCR